MAEKKNQNKTGEVCRNCNGDMPMIAVNYVFQCPTCGIRTTKTEEYIGKTEGNK